MKRSSFARPFFRWITVTVVLALFFSVCSQSIHAQSAAALQEVKKVYVDNFTGKLGAADLRQRIIDTLQKDRTVQIVPSPSQADAILKGNGEIWVKAYIAVNPRSPGSRYPIYGGFLSAQLVGKDHETLWSYLVTPGTYAPSGIRQNLVERLVRHLETAFHDAAVTGSPTQSQASIHIIKVAGATFPGPLYQAWIESFRQRRPDIQITYDAVGSEAGIQQLRDHKITFAASDVPLSASRSTEMPAPTLHFATVIGAVVPIYHLPQVSDDLRFTPEILAGIYLGKIRRWNDPVIKSVNRGANLPDAEIHVIHRTDGSGTTFAFTEFLSKTNPEWKAAVGFGTSVNWPTGQGVQGNDGVASTVERTPNSIGYTQLSFAIQRELSFGTVRNVAGNFVQANLSSLAAAVASAPSSGLDSLHASITNAPGRDAYPIASFTWLIVPETIHDAATKAAVADFLEWMLTSGQKECSALAYTPLPKEVVSREQQLLATFKSR